MGAVPYIFHPLNLMTVWAPNVQFVLAQLAGRQAGVVFMAPKETGDGLALTRGASAAPGR